MRRLLVLAAVTGLAMARPETYREKEDFQFSRSSSDEGSKSGFYGAQRGNMGGNYERAHNMDHLAQNQMSGLVRQVEGELGDGVKQRTGSVYTAANSRGIYGSGHYDLSNLEGRNFQEGVSYGDSQSSLTAHHGSAYKGQYAASTGSGYGASSHSQRNSKYGGYNAAGNSQQTYSNNHLATDDLQSASQYEDRNAAHNSGYLSQAGYQGHAYDQGSTLSHTSTGQGSVIHSRLVSGTPVKIIIRPGTRVTVPVAAQTYDASQSVTSFDQNAINSEAEVLNSDSQHVVLKPSRPKQYESSYSYRKEWEKHDTKPVAVGVPLAIPTVNPYPAHSELYEDEQEQRASRVTSQSHHSSHSGYNAHSTSSSQSSHQAEYNAQQHSAADNTDSTAYTNGYKGGATGAYNAGATAGHYKDIATGAYNGVASDGSSLHNRVEDSNTKPKSYQSSYSYHKSWEHQGDPYIIKPSTNGLYDTQASEKLVAASLNQGSFGSHQYGSRHHQSHQSYTGNSDVDCDCDENGHIRVARSYRTQNLEDLGQQTQQQWDDVENLGQQTQKQWGDLEEDGQHAQKKWDRIEDLSQQTENKWDKLQSEGQQTEQLWDQAVQQTQQQWDKIEHLGQQAQTQWDQQTQETGQQTQNAWDKLELEPQTQTDEGQESQQTWSMFEVQKSGHNDETTEQKQSVLGSPANEKHPGMNTGFQHQENEFQNTQSLDKHHRMHSHTLELEKDNQNEAKIWDEIKKEEIGQENEDTIESDLTQTADLGQQTQSTWSDINRNENINPTWHQSNKDQFDANNEAHFTGLPKPNPHPWMYYQAHHHQSEISNQYHSQSSHSNALSGSNSYSLHEHAMNMKNDSFSNTQTHSSGSTSGTSIMSLWDKLDTIAEDTIPSHRTDNDGNNNYETQRDISNVFATQNHQNVFVSHNTDSKSIQPTTVSSTSTTAKPDTLSTIKNDAKLRTLDIGRGDIGPEDSVKEQSDERPNPYKTSEEIETLSLTKETEKTDHHSAAQNTNIRTEDARDLSIVGLGHQNHSEDHKFKEEHSKAQSDITLTPSVTSIPKIDYSYMHHSVNSHRNEENHNMETQFRNQDQPISQQNHDFDQANNGRQTTDQKTLDFGQQNDNFGPQTGIEQMESEFETHKIGHSESHSEGKKYQTEDQKTQYFDQISLSGWQQEDQQEHQLENWGQHENLEQQTQTGWKENMESQQVQIAWEPTEDLQQHSQHTDNFSQPEDMENLNQQVQMTWEPTEDLQQHSKLTDNFSQPEEMENLNQQVQMTWEPTDDLQQHSKLTDNYNQPEEMENLNQQVQMTWEPTEDLQQHSQLTHTLFQPEKMENVNQQLQSTWKPIEDLQQQSQINDMFSQTMVQNSPSTDQKPQPTVSEDIIVPKKVADVDSPPEPTTEKPGFWKSVGGKFSNAKDKVASWFRSS